jgi:hypothetical protein
LDWALRSFLVGLEKIGPRLRLAGCKKGIGFRAYRHPPKPKPKLKPKPNPKLKSYSKGPLLSKSKIKASSGQVPEMLVALPVAMLEVLLVAVLVPATPLVVFQPDGFVSMTSNEENNMHCATPNDEENFHSYMY